MREISGRDGALARGFWLGGGAGLLVGLSLGLWTVAPMPRGLGTPADWMAVASTIMAFGLMAGMLAGSARAFYRVTVPAGRKWMARMALGFWLAGAAPISMLILVFSSSSGGDAVQAAVDVRLLVSWLVVAPLFLASLGACGAAVFAGTSEADEQDAILRKLDLDARRDELERAAEARFGPLDASQRERIRAYDEQHVIEAERRLPAAAVLDDLDEDAP
jgi:hypothetical protein